MKTGRGVRTCPPLTSRCVKDEEREERQTGSPEEHIALAERERPDLIIMDLSLPIVDGWEATRRIKANTALQHIPIIALSSHAMRGMRKKSGRPVR